MVNSGDRIEAMYALFKLSWSQFDCAPEQLNAKQKSEAASLIANQMEIERAVLGSDQCQGVVISEGQVHVDHFRVRVVIHNRVTHRM